MEHIQEVLKQLCADERIPGNYVIPHFHLKRESPFFTEEEFTYTIEIFLQTFIQVNQATFSQMMREVFFDGQGFLVPMFRMYINKKRENQLPNDLTVDGRGKKVPYYNFDMDKSFEQFCIEVYENLNSFDAWAKLRKGQIGNQANELFDFYNSKEGFREYSKPLERIIENLKKGNQ